MNTEMTFHELQISTKLPCFVAELNPKDNNLKLALSGIHEEYNKGGDGIVSNVKSVFTSSWFSHIENYKFQPLVSLVEDFCDNLAKDYFKKDLKFECFNCWGSIYHEGDYAIEHEHFPSLFSAVVYLKLEENSSNIFFDDTEITVKEGTLLIFPSILKHHVVPTKGKRVIVAMNLKVKQ
jgi:hypothetical protein